MFTYIKILLDEKTNEQAWGDHFHSLLVEKIIHDSPRFDKLLEIYSIVPDEKKDWYIDAILDSNLSFVPEFIKETFDGTLMRSQITYSYKDDYEFDDDLMEKVISVLKNNKQSSIARSLLAGKIVKD